MPKRNNQLIMAEIKRLISDIEDYVNSPNAFRAELDLQGKKMQSPDPEEQALRGYEVSQMGPEAKLLSLAWTTAEILKSGPDFYRGQDGVYVYKGLKKVRKNGAVAMVKVESMADVELVATHQAASDVGQDASIKFVKFADRPANETNGNNSTLEIVWEERDNEDIRLKREIIVFGQENIWRQKSFARQDRLGVTIIKLPVNESLKAKAEKVLRGVQGAVLHERGGSYGF